VRVAGDDMDEAIINHMKRAYNMMIGEQTAERIKIEIGSAAPVGESNLDGGARARHDLRAAPEDGDHSDEIREALQEPVTSITEAVTRTLERAEPELAADLVENGIALAGGGSLLRGLDNVVSEGDGAERAARGRSPDVRGPRDVHLPRELRGVEGHARERRLYLRRAPLAEFRFVSTGQPPTDPCRNRRSTQEPRGAC
jgi:cell division ATPase FtsA